MCCVWFCYSFLKLKEAKQRFLLCYGWMWFSTVVNQVTAQENITCYFRTEPNITLVVIEPEQDRTRVMRVLPISTHNCGGDEKIRYTLEKFILSKEQTLSTPLHGLGHRAVKRPNSEWNWSGDVTVHNFRSRSSAGIIKTSHSQYLIVCNCQSFLTRRTSKRTNERDVPTHACTISITNAFFYRVVTCDRRLSSIVKKLVRVECTNEDNPSKYLTDLHQRCVQMRKSNCRIVSRRPHNAIALAQFHLPQTGPKMSCDFSDSIGG